MSKPPKKLALASNELLTALPGISATMMAGKLVDSKLMRELGALLFSIARGEPANKMFRQHEKTKPKVNRGDVALVYHYVLACTGDEGLAVRKAALAQRFGLTGKEKPLSKSYVLKVAQTYRAAVLRGLATDPDGATDRARFYMLNTRQLFVLHNKGGDVAQGELSPQEAAEFAELMQYSLTAEKVARLREYFRRKSPRPT